MSKWSWGAFALVFIIPAATLAFRCWPRHDDRILPDDAVDFSGAYSNILPRDYVGPRKCGECHAGKFEQWSHHSHSKMNQLPSPASVQGSFDDQKLVLGNGVVRFTNADGVYRMTVERQGAFLRQYEVTRTVGSRFMQLYIGKQTLGPEPTGDAIYREHMLPFGYWTSLGRWLPKHFFDPDGPEEIHDGVAVWEGLDHIRDMRPYNAVCMNCHNTFAYSYRVFHPMFVGFPTGTVAAALGPLSQELTPTAPVRPKVDDFVALNGRLDPEQHLVSLGISCESCHFGGREHALAGQPIHFLPTSPLLKVRAKDEGKPLTADRRSAAAVNGICAQCHSGNARFFPNGAAECNSREGLDFAAGVCSSQLTCVKCHDPHVAGEPSGGPTKREHVDLCVTCHKQYAEPERAAVHGRHGAASGVTCLDCHMPRQTLGLDELVRTHRISQPVEASMIAAGTPNACNLCHLDKSQSWTLKELEQGWGRRIDPDAAKNAGLLDQPVGDLWLHSERQSLRVLATQCFARSPLGSAKLPDLLAALNDAEPINRVFALKAVERVTGKKLKPDEYELIAPSQVRSRQIEKLTSRLPSTH